MNILLVKHQIFMEIIIENDEKKRSFPKRLKAREVYKLKLKEVWFTLDLFYSALTIILW